MACSCNFNNIALAGKCCDLLIFKFSEKQFDSREIEGSHSGRFSISKQLQFISFISNYFWQSSVKSNKQARSNTHRYTDRQTVAAGAGNAPYHLLCSSLSPPSLRQAKGRVIAGDLTTTLEDKYFMKSHKQIKDESQTQQAGKRKRKITFRQSKSIGKKRGNKKNKEKIKQQTRADQI